MTDHRSSYVACQSCGYEIISDGLGDWLHLNGQYTCQSGSTAAEPAPLGQHPHRERGYYRDQLTAPWNARDAELAAKMKPLFARGLAGPA